MPAPCVAREEGELRAAQMNQCGVIAALQIDLGLPRYAVVDDNVEPIALARRRDGARSTVLEQLFNFMFSRQIDVKAKPQREIGQADMMRRRQNCQNVTASVAKDNRFGKSIARDPARPGGSRRRHGRSMPD